MREQAMIAETYAPTAGDPQYDKERGEILPAKKEKRHGREDVKQRYKSDRAPIKAIDGGYFEINDVLH
jgi:hypothetical protein